MTGPIARTAGHNREPKINCMKKSKEYQVAEQKILDDLASGEISVPEAALLLQDLEEEFGEEEGEEEGEEGDDEGDW